MSQATISPATPPTFKDAGGREWLPRLDYVKLRVIRDALKVDLGNVEEMGRTWALLLSDDLRSLDTIWLAIGGEGASALHVGQAITKDDWLSAMDGDRLEEARVALRDAIYLFTRPLKRNILLKGMGAVDEVYRAAMGEAETRVDREIQKSIDKAVTAMRGTRPPSARASSVTSTTAGASAKRSRRSRPNAATNTRARRGH